MAEAVALAVQLGWRPPNTRREAALEVFEVLVAVTSVIGLIAQSGAAEWTAEQVLDLLNQVF